MKEVIRKVKQPVFESVLIGETEVEEVVYIASNGKEFNNKDNCIFEEELIKSNFIKKNSIDLDIEGFSYFLIVHNLSELKIFSEYNWDLISCYKVFEKESFPIVLGVSREYNRIDEEYEYDVYKISDIIEKFKPLIEIQEKIENGTFVNFDEWRK